MVVVGSGGVVVGGGIGTRVVVGALGSGAAVEAGAEVVGVGAVVMVEGATAGSVVIAIVSGGVSDAATVPQAANTVAAATKPNTYRAILITTKVVHAPEYRPSRCSGTGRWLR